MLLRLSRLSFWLAAAAAAFALLAPGGREALLAAIAATASLLALTLLRMALRAEPAQQLDRTALATAPAPVLGEAELLGTAAQLVQAVDAAASFESALHRVARLLRSELGARRAAVLGVHTVGADHAEISDLVELQPGFRTVPRRIRLDTAPLAQALRTGGVAADLPHSAALAVGTEGGVAAAIELVGIDLAIEPRALGALLDAARQALTRTANRPPAAGEPTGLLVRRIAAAQRRTRLAHARLLVITDETERPPRAVVRMLRGVGCRVSVVFGMLDGLNALRRTQFDLILIDTPMPPTSALAAAKGMRTRLLPGPACDTPVIALSGRVLPGAEERFRELGFDDHLSKPLRRRELLAMLSKHLRPPETAASSDAAGLPVAAEPVLDPAALARLAELDPTGANRLLERVLLAFQASVTRLRPQLDAARADDDRAAIRLVAHTLKSSSASIGALRLSQLCAQIETAIRLESPDDLGGPLREFDAALDGALQAIDALIKERQ